ncbi:MAG: hypothetical protein R3244_02835 [Thermoanaerobaculia bacterium]|nr:hypothetical protein [Thermoanaerobaculia bacterium]
MKSVRKRHGSIWMVTLFVLAWACGGSGGSPTAPESVETNGIVTGEAKCGVPPCGGGGGGGDGGGNNKAEDIEWRVSASGSLRANEQTRSLASDTSMRFDRYRFVSDNVDFEQLQRATEYPDAAICFSDTFYSGDDLIVEQNPKTGEYLAVYRFAGQRLDLSRPITYEIVFRELQLVTGSWPPQVGTTELSGARYDVAGVAQRNNTCNGSGTLPDGAVTFTLVGSVP